MSYWGQTWSLLRLVKDRCVVCSHLLRTDMKFAHTCQEQMCICSQFTLIKDRHEVCSDLLRTDMMFPTLADGRREWANLPLLEERHEDSEAYWVQMWGRQSPTSAVMCCKQQMLLPIFNPLISLTIYGTMLCFGRMVITCSVPPSLVGGSHPAPSTVFTCWITLEAHFQFQCNVSLRYDQ